MQAHFVRYVRFFQLSKVSTQPLGPEFWRAIPVYKSGRRMDVALIDSPDCSVKTIALHSYQNGLVDLLVSKRRPSKGNPFPPQNTPVPQQVDVLRLTRAGESSHGYPRGPQGLMLLSSVRGWYLLSTGSIPRDHPQWIAAGLGRHGLLW